MIFWDVAQYKRVTAIFLSEYHTLSEHTKTIQVLKGGNRTTYRLHQEIFMETPLKRKMFPEVNKMVTKKKVLLINRISSVYFENWFRSVKPVHLESQG